MPNGRVPVVGAAPSTEPAPVARTEPGAGVPPADGPDERLLIVGLPALAVVLMVLAALPGWWNLALAAMVVAAGHRAYALHRAVSDTRSQLVAALGSLPELAGHGPRGAARGTAQLVAAIAADLGLDAGARTAVVAAGTCRAVGGVGFDSAPHRRPGFGAPAVERWSARILAPVPGLDEPAELIATDVADLDPARRRLRAIVDVAASYQEARDTGASPCDAVAALRRTAPPEAAALLDALATHTFSDPLPAGSAGGAGVTAAR